MVNKTKKTELDEAKFWDVLKRRSKVIGKELVYKVLQLYYVMLKGNVSLQHKAVIVGALAYLILPVDAVPDFIPVYGWADDASVITAALIAVADAVDDDVNAMAEKQCNKYFGKSIIAA